MNNKFSFLSSWGRVQTRRNYSKRVLKGSCKKLLILANISAKALKAVKITDFYSIILVLAVKAVKYPVKHGKFIWNGLYEILISKNRKGFL